MLGIQATRSIMNTMKNKAGEDTPLFATITGLQNRLDKLEGKYTDDKLVMLDWCQDLMNEITCFSEVSEVPGVEPVLRQLVILYDCIKSERF